MGHGLMLAHPEAVKRGEIDAQTAYDAWRDDDFYPKTQPRFGDATDDDPDAVTAYFAALYAEWDNEVSAELSNNEDARMAFVSIFNTFAQRFGCSYPMVASDTDEVRECVRRFVMTMDAIGNKRTSEAKPKGGAVRVLDEVAV